MYDPYDFALILLGVLLLLLGLLLLWHKKRPSLKSPGVEPPRLFTPDEQDLYGILEQSVGKEAIVLGKIRLSDLLRGRAGVKENKTSLESSTAPFVLCRRSDMAAVAIVTLDGDLDAGTLEAAGLPVVRLRAEDLPAPEELAEKLAAVLRPRGPAAGQEDWELGSLDWLEPEEESDWLAGLVPPQKDAPAENSDRHRPRQKTAELFCPECGAGMEKRRMARGPYAGRELWTCPNFPRCRKTLPVLPD